MANRSQMPAGSYIEHRTTVRVRFCEVDSLQVVWHGHYLKYFEDAREALGRRFGISYADIRDAGLIAPLVHASCEYLAPARAGDELDIVARLFLRDSAKIEFFYEVRRPADSALLAVGRTVQVFTDVRGELLLTLPQFMESFYRRWNSEAIGNP